MSDIFTRCYAEIDLEAIKSNFDNLKALCGKNVKTMAVVKADAYGHGAVEVATALADRADFFAVACTEEGIEVRKAGVNKQILVLGYCAEAEYKSILEYDIIPTIYSVKDAQALSRCAEEYGKTAKIHIAVDTGMGRIGFFDDEDGIESVLKISKLPFIEIQGLFSHYSKADYKDKTAVMKQNERFDAFISALEQKGIFVPIKHICNSAGIIDLDKHYDMVRMGISLYGMYPSDEVDKSKVELTPAMKVVSHIIHLKTVKEGTEIGYGGIYKTDKERKIATVCIGYADGYKRNLTGKGYVLVNGCKAPITGKICMDQIMIDVTDIPNISVGMPVTVMGKDGSCNISAETLSSLCDSFCYEIVCSFTQRVKRRYKE